MQRDFGAHSVINRAKPNREMTMNISTPSTALRGLIAAAIFGALASTSPAFRDLVRRIGFPPSPSDKI
jgi:hypothetical protein